MTQHEAAKLIIAQKGCDLWSPECTDCPAIIPKNERKTENDYCHVNGEPDKNLDWFETWLEQNKEGE